MVFARPRNQKIGCCRSQPCLCNSATPAAAAAQRLRDGHGLTRRRLGSCELQDIGEPWVYWIGDWPGLGVGLQGGGAHV